MFLPLMHVRGMKQRVRALMLGPHSKVTQDELIRERERGSKRETERERTKESQGC